MSSAVHSVQVPQYFPSTYANSPSRTILPRLFARPIPYDGSRLYTGKNVTSGDMPRVPRPSPDTDLKAAGKSSHWLKYATANSYPLTIPETRNPPSLFFKFLGTFLRSEWSQFQTLPDLKKVPRK